MAVIYVLKDPRSGEVRYVGQTLCAIEKRLREHLCLARKGSQTYSGRWIRTLLDAGVWPGIEVIEETSDPDAREKYWIIQYRAAGARLTNLTEGGDGGFVGPRPPLTEAQRAKLRTALLGKPKSAEARANMRKPKSEAARKNMAAARKGRKNPPLTDAQRAKLSAALKGRKQAPEHTAKTAAAVRAAVAEGRFQRPQCPPERLARGSRSPKAKLREQDVMDIRERYAAGGQSSIGLAKEYGVSQGVIFNALIGKAWAHVGGPLHKPAHSPDSRLATGLDSPATSRTPRAKIYPAEVARIRTEYAAGGVTGGELAERWRLKGSQISRILRGRSWSWVPGPVFTAEEISERTRQAAIGQQRGPCPADRCKRISEAKIGQNVKFTDEVVREIRARYAAGEGSTAALAREYGASQQWVADVVAGRKRQHVRSHS